jgi:hypothetical protein
VQLFGFASFFANIFFKGKMWGSLKKNLLIPAAFFHGIIVAACPPQADRNPFIGSTAIWLLLKRIFYCIEHRTYEGTAFEEWVKFKFFSLLVS